MRVLLTRPLEDARPLADELRARGHTAVLAPMLHIRIRQDVQLDLSDVQAVLFTSANGVRAFGSATGRRDLPVLAVGGATAEAARAEGFREVTSADGDVHALAELVRTRLGPHGGVLFHAAGSVTAGDLKGMLETDGFRVRRVRLYEAVPAEGFPEDAKAALRDGRIDAVLFFSPRTAKTFVTLLQGAELSAACTRMSAACLSHAVAEAVEALPWHSVRVAERPERAALLRSLETVPAGAAKETMSDQTPKGQPPKDQAPKDTDEDKADAATGGEHPSQKVISAFGGIRPMAHKLGIAVSTVQGWKNRGLIPESRHRDILDAAKRNKIDLDPDVLKASAEEPEGAPGETGADEPARRRAEPAKTADARKESDPSAAGEHAVAAEAVAASAAEGSRVSRSAAATATERGDDGATAGPAAGGPPSGAAPPPPPERRPGGWIPGMLLGAAILAIAVGGTVVTRDSWLPLVMDVEEPSTAVADLETRLTGELERIDSALADLEQRTDIAEVTQTMEGLAALRDRLEQTSGRLEAAGSRVDEISGRLDQLAGDAAEAEALASLEDRLDTQLAELRQSLEAQADDLASLREEQAQLADLEEVRRLARAEAGHEVAQALAISELRDALRFAGPFADELQVAQRIVDADSELAPLLAELEPHAETGIATRDELLARFDGAANQAMARAAEDAGHGWVGGMLRRLTDAVNVRPVGDQIDGERTGALLASAETRLHGGDLKGAVETLDRLRGGPREAMEPWMEHARGRVAAEETLSRVSTHMIDTIARAGGNGG